MDVALGAAVRLRRLSLGMSQQVLAAACGITFQQVQKYETGANRISFSRLVQIARALQCHVVDLVAVLDAAQVQRSWGVDLFVALRTPGASEVLGAYERLGAEARLKLLRLVTALTSNSYDASRAEAEAATGARALQMTSPSR
jgi:transcriptional regulator with XRE-family HTH domain